MWGRIQIAGIRDEAEARLLLNLGVDDLGFPLGPGVATPDTDESGARRILAGIPSPHGAVIITYLSRAEEILSLLQRVGATRVQLHGRIAVDELRKLRALSASLYVIKSLVVRPENRSELLRELGELSPFADAFLTDTFDPATGQCGATGRTHDWATSRVLAAASPRPLVLAGGLTPENVAGAIDAVKPAAVDSHTGVEGPDGRKDPEKVRRFVSEARRAFERSVS